MTKRYIPRKPVDFTTCHCCKGTGRLEVTGVYAETLRGLRRWCARPGRYVVANRDARQFGCEPTALNNRLVWLERNGLATSVRYGRQRRFTPK